MLDGCVPWPAEIAARYRREGYWRGESLGSLLSVWARRSGDRPALIAGDATLSYQELDCEVHRLAAGLNDLGFRAKDRVVVHLPNVPELLLTCFACFRLGALPVLALPLHRRNEILHLVQASDAVGYVIPDVVDGFDYRGLAEEVTAAATSLRHILVAGDAGRFVALSDLRAEPRALPEPDAGDVAFFLLSGGTIGLPKLIPRTHDDYAYNIRASCKVAGLTECDVYLAVLPVAHNYALGSPGVLGVLSVGGSAVLTQHGSPDEAFALIERHGVTVTGLVPPLALTWMEAVGTADADLSGLRLVQVGGSKLLAPSAYQFRVAFGARLQQSFGMGEGLLSQSRLDDPENVVATTQGRPVSPADELRIVDAAGRLVAQGETGQLQVRGPYTIRGYYRSPEHNARAFTADGYFRTGDLVRETRTGDLVVEGRVTEVINRGGDKVSAEEVEDHLLFHPRVLDAAVVAMPDAFMGERTCVFVVPRDESLTLDDLNVFLEERGLAPYKLPDRLELLRTLPVTSVGKVSRSALRNRIARMQQGAQT